MRKVVGVQATLGLPTLSYTYLLATKGHLGGHDTLSFGNQCALGAHAVLPTAVSLVALEVFIFYQLCTLNCLSIHLPLEPKRRHDCDIERIWEFAGNAQRQIALKRKSVKVGLDCDCLTVNQLTRMWYSGGDGRCCACSGWDCAWNCFPLIFADLDCLLLKLQTKTWSCLCWWWWSKVSEDTDLLVNGFAFELMFSEALKMHLPGELCKMVKIGKVVVSIKKWRAVSFLSRRRVKSVSSEE